MIPQRPAQPFDEKAALAELERLRESIQAARKARQRTSDEFEAFVKGFRTPASKPITQPPPAAPRAPQVAQQPVSEPISRPLQSPDSVPSPAVLPPSTDALHDETVPPLASMPARSGLNTRLLGILAVIAVIAVGLLWTRWQGDTSPPAPVTTVTDNAAPTPSGAAPTPAASPAAPPPATAHSVVVELKILRPVWMRVVVDGRKDVEGMVPAGDPLHFAGDQSIVVRVGNGADVLVKTGNREESFGETGQPLTRRFSKP